MQRTPGTAHRAGTIRLPLYRHRTAGLGAVEGAGMAEADARLPCGLVRGQSAPGSSSREEGGLGRQGWTRERDSEYWRLRVRVTFTVAEIFIA